MANVFLAKSAGPQVVAPALPSAVPASWPGLSAMTWTTPDGDTFDLLDSSGGTLLMNTGVRGLTFPAIKAYRDELAGVDGSVYRGHRYPSREVFWPLLVFSDGGSDAWVSLNRIILRALHPSKVGTWTLTLSTGEVRSLRVRFSGDGGPALSVDPSKVGWLVHGLTFMADEPLWSGQRQVRSWGPAQVIDFFGGGDGTGMGPPFGISSASTIDSAWVVNPGDESAWPVWTAYGPFTSATFGVAGQQVQAPFSLPAGRALVLDTDPTARQAFECAVSTDDNGNEVLTTVAERTRDLGNEAYAPIPAGSSVSLNLAMSGTGRVQAAFTPRYLTAWS